MAAIVIDAARLCRLTVADAIYVALADDLGGDFLTDDHRFAKAPTFPPQVTVLRLPVRP